MSEPQETKIGPVDDGDLSDASSTRQQDPAQNAPAQGADTNEPSKSGKAVLYGTRKRRPGSADTEKAPDLTALRGAFEEEEIIEMDDLPVRANVSPNLVQEGNRPDGDREPRRERRGGRERGERGGRDRGRRERGGRRSESEPRERRERRSERPSPFQDADERTENVVSPAEDAVEPTSEPTGREPVQEDDSPERRQRFETADVEARRARAPAQEFRPSRDGKRKPPADRQSRDRRPYEKPEKTEKKGLVAWVKGLFTPEEPEPAKPRRESRRDETGEPRREGGNRNRRRSGGGRAQGGNRGERRGEGRSGEGRPRGDGDRPRRRRGGQQRRRRPQGERNQSRSES